MIFNDVAREEWCRIAHVRGSVSTGSTSMDRTALYRHFDTDGVLLYVGISLNAIARLAQHRRSATWFDQIAKIEIEWHPTRPAAIRAEVEAIQSERPLHNIAHTGMPDSLLAMLRTIGKVHMVGPDGILLPEFASLSEADADELADRL